MAIEKLKKKWADTMTQLTDRVTSAISSEELSDIHDAFMQHFPESWIEEYGEDNDIGFFFDRYVEATDAQPKIINNCINQVAMLFGEKKNDF